MEWLLVALVFGCIALLALVILSALFSDERSVKKRLDGLTAYESDQAGAAHPTLLPMRERVVTPLAHKVSGGLAGMAPTGYRAKVQHRLQLAGSPHGVSADRFIAAKVLAGLGAFGLNLGIIAIWGTTPVKALVSVLMIVIAFFAPDLWLNNAVENRKLAIRRALPDMLDMLTISVEAGLGFDAAIAKLARTTRGPLTEEFSRMLQQIQAGVDRKDAMRFLADRTDVPELNGFLSAMVQAETFGVSVANVLRTQAKEMRLKRRQYAEEQAQKAPVKIVFPLVLCIMPATLIVILGPAIVDIGRAFGLL